MARRSLKHLYNAQVKASGQRVGWSLYLSIILVKRAIYIEGRGLFPRPMVEVDPLSPSVPPCGPSL